MMIGLNMLLIPLYGINGAAWATLISIVVYNAIKLLFVIKKMDLYPFTMNTVKSMVVIVLVFVTFYFWDFDFHPIVNIGLKSILIAVVYGYINYRFVISPEINQVLDKVLVRFKRP